ncbi:hypothetical protein HG531_000667 [Fusarium graminearum]|nr:hypothetical protein HG531_000667 [Fusarium graminearum]
MAMDSTPAKEKTALVITDQYPRNLPQLPVAMYSTKGPGFFQYLKPMRSVPGIPPKLMTKPKMMRNTTSRILRRANQNSTSPKTRTKQSPTTVRSDLSQGELHGAHYEANGRITKQRTQRTAGLHRLAQTEEQTCSNGAGDTKHRQMPFMQAALEILLFGGCNEISIVIPL